jgi:hypothetical protein
MRVQGKSFLSVNGCCQITEFMHFKVNGLARKKPKKTKLYHGATLRSLRSLEQSWTRQKREPAQNVTETIYLRQFGEKN